MKKRRALAIIIPGGIGTGKNNLGVPVLIGLVKRISAHYDLTVFQLSTTNAGFEPDGFELISVYHPNALIRFLRFPSIFRKHHKTKNFVAVHGFWAMPAGMLATIVGKRHKIKSIVSLLGGDAVGVPQIDYGRLHKPFMRALTFWTLGNAGHVNALTKYLVNSLRNFGFKSEIEVIPWGVDRELFDYHPKPFNMNDRSYTFLHVANLHPVKDQTTLLRTFSLIHKQFPSSKLIIVGTGIDQKKVLAVIEQLKLNSAVEIHPPVANEKLASYYHNADILLHTSVSEGQSEVVTEAMSSGLPVCGTSVGLLYDQPDCCISVYVGAWETLAAKTIDLLSDPERINEVRMKAYEWTSHHDINWTAQKYLNLYGS